MSKIAGVAPYKRIGQNPTILSFWTKVLRNKYYDTTYRCGLIFLCLTLKRIYTIEICTLYHYKTLSVRNFFSPR